MRAGDRAYRGRMALDTALSAFMPRALTRQRRVTFDEAVRDHQDELYGVALRILGDRDTAMDATSRALIKAYRSWARYDQDRPVRHWLLRIVSNEAISLGRSRSRDRGRGARPRSPRRRNAARALPRAGRAAVLQRSDGRRDRRADRPSLIDRRRAAAPRALAAARRARGTGMSDDRMLDEATIRR